MRRFLIFPCAVALGFFFWVAASATELMLMTWAAFLARNPVNAPARIADLGRLLLSSIWLTCVGGGAVAGLAWALADCIAHRRDQGVALRLLPNLFWCAFYATLLIASNGVVFYGALLYYLQSHLKSPLFVEELALYGCLSINALAVICAVAGTTATRHLLTPRCLFEALKKRSRLQ